MPAPRKDVEVRPGRKVASKPVCLVCGFQARGFWFQHGLSRFDKEPYSFCSVQCLSLGASLAGEFGLIDPRKLTDMEQASIRDARALFAEALERFHLMDAFFNASPEVIDAVIAAAWEGCRQGMQKRSQLSDAIPF